MFVGTTMTASKLMLPIEITGPQVWKLKPTNRLMNNDTINYCSCVSSVRKTVDINKFIKMWLANHIPVGTLRIPCALRSDFRYM